MNQIPLFICGVCISVFMLTGIVLYKRAQKKEDNLKQLQFSNWGD